MQDFGCLQPLLREECVQGCMQCAVIFRLGWEGIKCMLHWLSQQCPFVVAM